MTSAQHNALAGRDVVYVVAKAPRAGHSKTRLCPPLSPQQAADLAAAFLQDTVSLALRAGPAVRLICPDPSEREALLRLVPIGTTVHVQDGDGLGAALESAFTQGMRDGFRAVGVLGMDLPTLPPAVISRAFDSLRDGADVAFGPSHDGGYYFLAARQLHPHLFRDMEWSTKAVGQETLRRCAALGLRTHLVDRWLDVDDTGSLAALSAQLVGAAADVAPHSRAALRHLDRLL